MNERHLQSLMNRVLGAYEARGLSRALVGEWAVSENDAGDLIQAAIEAQPRRILEVGTYVGVSTMLLALACPQAEVFSVDPDFPLNVEMETLGTRSNVPAAPPTHHALAREAALRLGVSDRVHLVKGGFSVGETFASTFGGHAGAIEVIGPAFCAAHGPFDLVFIDGLHTSQAVYKDLTLAAAHLSAGAPILLHDCIGYWGAAVREGIFEFLRRHPDYMFTHAPYRSVYRSIGTLRIAAGANYSFPFRPPNQHTTGLASSIEGLANSLFPSGWLEVAFSKPWLADADRKQCVLLSADVNDHADALGSIASAKAAGSVCVELADFVSDQLLVDVLRASTSAGKPALLGVTPPGEFGVAGPQSRPLVRLLDLVQAAGAELFLLPFAAQEHMRYGMLPDPRELSLSSKFLTFAVAAAAPEFRDASGRSFSRLTPEGAHEHEQQALQRLHLSAGFRQQFGMAEDLRHQVREQSESAEDLRRQVREQTAGAEDLNRQVREQTAAAEDLRRQVREQAAAAEDRLRQVREQTATAEDLRRQVQEQTAAAEDLRHQIRARIAAGDTRQLEFERQMRELREQLVEKNVEIARLTKIESQLAVKLIVVYQLLDRLDTLTTEQQEVLEEIANPETAAPALPGDLYEMQTLEHRIKAITARAGAKAGRHTFGANYVAHARVRIEGTGQIIIKRVGVWKSALRQLFRR